jgi:hypothetical protein
MQLPPLMRQRQLWMLQQAWVSRAWAARPGDRAVEVQAAEVEVKAGPDSQVSSFIASNT